MARSARGPRIGLGCGLIRGKSSREVANARDDHISRVLDFDEKRGLAEGAPEAPPRACFGQIAGHLPGQVSAMSRPVEVKSRPMWPRGDDRAELGEPGCVAHRDANERRAGNGDLGQVEVLLGTARTLLRTAEVANRAITANRELMK
jgi:hypothetical protein